MSPVALVTPTQTDEGLGRSEYCILATSSPQAMLRILGLFAQRDLLPGQVRMNVIDDAIWVALTIDGLTRHQAQVVAVKLRVQIDTRSVDLSWVDRAS